MTISALMDRIERIVNQKSEYTVMQEKRIAELRRISLLPDDSEEKIRAREEAIKTLKDAGIIDGKGNLAKPYR